MLITIGCVLAAWFAAASAVVVTIVVAGHSLGNRGGPSSTVSTMRERLGAVAAAFGLRVTDVVIEGRENTPEPLLRAAIGVV